MWACEVQVGVDRQLPENPPTHTHSVLTPSVGPFLDEVHGDGGRTEGEIESYTGSCRLACDEGVTLSHRRSCSASSPGSSRAAGRGSSGQNQLVIFVSAIPAVSTQSQAAIVSALRFLRGSGT